MTKLLFLDAVLAAISFTPSAGVAGIYTDDLTRCLVEPTTEADRTKLMQWMFAGFSHHPAVSSMVSVSGAERETINQNAAIIFESLLTKSCKVEAQKAIQYEGDAALSEGF